MSQDEIVDEVRRAREKIAARFEYDLGRLFKALEAEEAKGGGKVVSRPSRRAVAPAKVSK
jgi:hypothetical protein